MNNIYDIYNKVFQKVDCEIILRYYDIDYKLIGDEASICCIYHNESKPSLMLNIEKKIFKCWGCNKTGNIFTLILKCEGKENYNDAVNIAAKLCKIDVKEISRNNKIIFEMDLIDISEYIQNYGYDIQNEIFLDSAIKKYYHKFHNYFVNRGFKKETLKYFEMGFCDDKKDFMYNRCIFPIRNENKKLVGWTGRTVINDLDPKWKHAPKDRFYKSLSLFNIDKAIEYIINTNIVYVVESVANCIRLYEFGIKNCIAILGNIMSIEQAYLLKKIANEIRIIYDNDLGGYMGIDIVIDLLGLYNVMIGVYDFGYDENGKALDLADINEKEKFDEVVYYSIDEYTNISFRRVINVMNENFERDVKLMLSDGNVILCTNKINKKNNSICQLIPEDILFIRKIDNTFSIKDIKLNK